MARYTSLFTIETPTQQIQSLVRQLLESKDLGLNVIYDTGDYVVAREQPGQVTVAQLVTVEVLIDRTQNSSENTLRMNVVVKNEELPLQVDNHCHRWFNDLNQAIAASQQWRLIESVA